MMSKKVFVAFCSFFPCSLTVCESSRKQKSGGRQQKSQVDNRKRGVDNKKALELTNGIIFLIVWPVSVLSILLVWAVWEVWVVWTVWAV